MLYFEDHITGWASDYREDNHNYSVDMRLGEKLPASAGTYEMEQMDFSGVNESWKGKNIKYTITRHPSAFNDTIELSFTGMLKQVLPADKNDSAVITGKMRAVYVSVP